jgi:hypothetical protein
VDTQETQPWSQTANTFTPLTEAKTWPMACASWLQVELELQLAQKLGQPTQFEPLM